MQDMLKRLAKKSRARELSPAEVEAKSSVLKHLIGDMDGMMGDKLKGLKKVTVASDSPEGLEQGLEHAHEMVNHAHQDHDDMEDHDEENESKFGDIRHTDDPEEQEEHQENPSELENEDEQEEDKDDDLEPVDHEEDKANSDIEEKLKKLKHLKERK